MGMEEEYSLKLGMRMENILDGGARSCKVHIFIIYISMLKASLWFLGDLTSHALLVLPSLLFLI